MLWDWVMGTYRAHPRDPGSIESRRKLDAEHARQQEVVNSDKEKVG